MANVRIGALPVMNLPSSVFWADENNNALQES